MDQIECLYRSAQPNITYFAVGNSWKDHQRYPSFIKKMVLEYSNFKFMIILFGPEKVEFHVIQKDSRCETIVDNKSDVKKLISFLIDQTISTKISNPKNTCLLLVHDFTEGSGYNLVDYVDDYMKKLLSTNLLSFSNNNLALKLEPHSEFRQFFGKNVMVDLGYRLVPGHLLDENVPLWFLIDQNGTVEIFNPFSLDVRKLANFLSCENYQLRKLAKYSIVWKLTRYGEKLLKNPEKLDSLVEVHHLLGELETIGFFSLFVEYIIPFLDLLSNF
ncbi:MAG: hypothetical protein QW303_06670 [Nitrososphaerota archaeon]